MYLANSIGTTKYKTATSFAYYDSGSLDSTNSGLVASITAPQPGTVDALGTGATVETADFNYDAIGNMTVAAFPNANSSTGYDETQFAIFDNLGNATKRIDGRGVDVTGQTGTGHGTITNAYLYVGGPMLSTTTYDESAVQARQVTHTYGQEAEMLTTTGSTEPVAYAYDAAYRESPPMATTTRQLLIRRHRQYDAGRVSERRNQ